MAFSPFFAKNPSLNFLFSMTPFHLQPFLSLLLLALSLSSLLLLISLFRTRPKTLPKPSPPPPPPPPPPPLFVDILPDGPTDFRPDPDPDVSGEDCDRAAELKGKKKKKRAKKKRQGSHADDEEPLATPPPPTAAGDRSSSDCVYPFTSAASATQRKIKQHYDQLVKSNDAKALTMAQVGQFANCLVEARNELQHKSEVIQRKFTITKALLFKADRSSFDRLYQQIHKLEAEQKRLEEDAAVYNRLQEQLKLSPAYKQMLEIGVRMELQARSGKTVETPDADFADISFEELLAQEKKDSFWQRNGKLRTCMT